MTSLPAIQSFVGDDTGIVDPRQCLPDWDNLRLFTVALVDPCPLTRFGFTTGLEEAFADVHAFSAYPEPISVDPFGNLYLKKDTSNYTGVVQVSGASLAEGLDFGTPSSVNNQPYSIPLPAAFANLRTGNANFLICGGLEHPVPHGPVISALVAGLGLSFAGHNYTIDELALCMCAGPQASTAASAYTLGGPIADIDTQQLGLYVTTVSPLAVTYAPSTWPTANAYISTDKIGIVVPTDIDAGWTTIYGRGIAYDTLDGNLIVQVTSTGVDGSYIAKLSKDDASVLWKVQIAHAQDAYLQLAYGRTAHGTFAYFSQGGAPSASAVYVIDTADGSYTTITAGLAGVTLLGGQCFDEINGCVVAYGSFSKTTDSPLQLNSTPDSFTGWFALYVTARYVPPRIPGGRISYGRIWRQPG